jgi:hypothetical protein
MDAKKDDSKIFRISLLSEFKEQDNTDTIDYIAMEATWLSKRQLAKMVGSLAIRFEQPAAAKHLI